VVVVTGVTAEGNREVLGCDVGDSEDGTFWTAFLRGFANGDSRASDSSSPISTSD